MKAKINTLCKDLMMSRRTGFVSAPIVLMVYLGEETYHVVNASLNDAFTTSFRVEPDVHEICITDPGMNGGQILDQMVERIRMVADQGRNYSEVKITYVTLMDDPMFRGDCQQLSSSLRMAAEQLNSYGINTRQTSLYGIFRQVMNSKVNYGYAFEFVNSGKDMWKSIYHMEVSVFDSGIHKYTQLLAANNMSDDYTMVQDMDSPEYRWKSIYVHCLKVPELIVAKLLQNIYDGQINGQNINVEAWSVNVAAELNSVFERLFKKQEYHCEQYIPLNYKEEAAEQSSGRWPWNRGIETQTATAKSNLILDEQSIPRLLDALYGDISLNEQDYESVMERIISAASSLDNNAANIAQSIGKFLDKMIRDYQAQLEHMRSNQLFSHVDVNMAAACLQETYGKQREMLILEKKIEIIQNLIRQLSNGNYLSRMIQNICKKSKEYTDCLSELIRNEYGGIQQREQFDMTGFPEFKVNEPADEILKGIGNMILTKITNDEKLIYNNLEQFLHFTMSTTSMNKGHSLGMINGKYNQLEPIIPILLATPEKCQEMPMMDIFQTFSNLQVRTDSLYRDNSFYVLTSRAFSSDRYISRYKRV